MIIEVQGDIRDTDCQVIAHGVNCQGVMGSGVARALFEKWPEVRSVYLDYVDTMLAREGWFPNTLLGMINYVYLEDKKIIANCFTQQNFGSDGQLYLNYLALSDSLYNLNDYMDKFDLKTIALPKIGCGLAGGDWEIVKLIIEHSFSEDKTVKVYSL